MFEHLAFRVNDRTINYIEAQKISKRDAAILRDLALRVAELASLPAQEEKKVLWLKHNALGSTRPLIMCDPENGWNEVITDEDIICENEVARFWEVVLRKDIFWGDKMGDDRVIEPFFNVPHVYVETDWGLKTKKIGEAEIYRLDGGSFIWDSPLKNYSEMHQLKFPKVYIDHKTSDEVLGKAQEIFEDILKVRQKTTWWHSLGLTDDLGYLIGMEKMLYDFIENPQKIHELMAFLRDGILSKLDYLEEEGLLSLNNDGSYVGSGGFGWSEELPQIDFSGKVRTMDMWCHSESQITIGVSPQMFQEFVFSYQLPIVERFGLNCYGCCEPLEKRWNIINKIPRLRRVSVSKWSDMVCMAEKLADKYILSMKPDPADLARPLLVENTIREKIRDALKITRDCRVELCMKDNHTIGKNPNNLIEWCKIAREEAMNLS